MPKVSIIMATYNRAHLIEETLLSIQNQTFKNWECLIIDDGSTDTTQFVLKPYLINDSRVKYHVRPSKYKKGLPGCRNFGLDKAKGDYIIFFDDDDIVHPQNLEFCTKVLKNGSIQFCVYNKKSFNGNFSDIFSALILKEEKRKFSLFNFISGKMAIASCTVMWRSSCFNKIRFNEHLMYAEEWECYTRILTYHNEGVFLENILYFNRKHSKSNTGEFWNYDPVRRESKVEACRLVLDTLATKGLLTYRFGVSFISMSHFLKEKRVFHFLNSHKKAFSTFEYLKLNIRYFGNRIIYPLYKIKAGYDKGS